MEILENPNACRGQLDDTKTTELRMSAEDLGKMCYSLEPQTNLLRAVNGAGRATGVLLLLLLVVVVVVVV